MPFQAFRPPPVWWRCKDRVGATALQRWHQLQIGTLGRSEMARRPRSTHFGHPFLSRCEMQCWFVPLLGNSSPFFLHSPVVLCRPAPAFPSSPSRPESLDTAPHPQVRADPRRPCRRHSGCVVQVMTLDKEKAAPPPRRSCRRAGTTQGGSLRCCALA